MPEHSVSSNPNYRERKVGRGRIKEWRCPQGHWIMFVIWWRGRHNVCPECAAEADRGV